MIQALGHISSYKSCSENNSASYKTHCHGVYLGLKTYKSLVSTVYIKVIGNWKLFEAVSFVCNSIYLSDSGSFIITRSSACFTVRYMVGHFHYLSYSFSYK